MGFLGQLLYSLALSASAATVCPERLVGYRAYPEVRYPDGISVRHVSRWLGLYDRVHIAYPDGGEVSFNRTNRTPDRMIHEKLYPVALLSLRTLVGKEVLDIGCGGGAFVENLRAKGVNAYGSDIILTPRQRKKPYLVQAQSTALPFPPDSFDVVYSTWSFLAYEGGKPDAASQARVASFLREVARVTKVGGLIRLSPVPHEQVSSATETEIRFPAIEKALADIPNLKLVRGADAAWVSQSYFTETVCPRDTPIRMSASAWVELTKASDEL